MTGGVEICENSLGFRGHLVDLPFSNLDALLGHFQGLGLNVQKAELLGHFDLGYLQVGEGLKKRGGIE